MKLGNLLKHIPIHQSITLEENFKEIAKGHSQYIDIIAHKDKTVGLIYIQDNRIRISVYDRK